MIWLVHNAYFMVENPETGDIDRRTIAWPWYAPIGSTMTFILGWLLAGKRSDREAE